MIKLIADLISLNNISRYHVDGLVINDDIFSNYHSSKMTFNDLKSVIAYCQEHHILSIVNVERIIEEEELELLYERLESYLALEVNYFLYSDFAVLSFFLEKKMTDKLIYDAKTMITNKHDALFHRKYGSLVAISNELSLEEVENIVEAKTCVIEAYGFHQMFYSRRPLLSTYAKFKELPLSLEQKQLFIKEELRDELYPIFQSQYGTYVYTPYRYVMFKELLPLKERIAMVRINSQFIDEDEIVKVIDLYQSLLFTNQDPDELYLQLKALNDNISSGYLDKKSILVKERDL